MLYVLETGEYSDFSFSAILQGPGDVNVEEAYEEASIEAFKRRQAEDNPIYIGDTSMFLIPEMVKALERRGCEELTCTDIHLGNYGKAHLEVNGTKIRGNANE